MIRNTKALVVPLASALWFPRRILCQFRSLTERVRESVFRIRICTAFLARLASARWIFLSVHGTGGKRARRPLKR